MSADTNKNGRGGRGGKGSRLRAIKKEQMKERAAAKSIACNHPGIADILL